LHYAAIEGRLAIAKRLLEGGADPTLGNNVGMTALDYARREGKRAKSEVVALLSEPRYAMKTERRKQSAADVMSDSMGKAVFEAARYGNEAELTRLIGLGGNVNWRNPDVVRRRMCLAWAPASSPPLLLSPPETAPVPQSSLYSALRRWLRRHPAAPPSLAHASSSHGARRTPACSPTLLACSGIR